jgi:hypothetical protein
MFAKSSKKFFFFSFNVLTAFVIWVVTPNILAKAHPHFRGSPCHHRQGKGTDATASPNPATFGEFLPKYTASKTEKQKNLKLSLHRILQCLRSVTGTY